MRHLRAFITIGILVVLFLAALWQARMFFLQNKVTFLLNQKRFDEAGLLVKKLDEKEPGNPKVQFLKLKSTTLTGGYRAAAEQVLDKEVAEKYPEVLYWLALSNWQLSRNHRASQLARKFLQSRESLPLPGSLLIAQRLAGQKMPLPESGPESREFKLLFSVEQAVYLAMLADMAMELGRVDQAAEFSVRAFNLGNRNKRSLLSGAEAAAISGKGEEAEMLLTYSGEDNILRLYEKLSKAYEVFNSSVRTIHDQDIAGRGGRLDLARALSWVSTVYLAENTSANMYPVLRVMAELQQNYPYDRIISVNMAHVLETLLRYDEAYALYKKLFLDAPNIVLGLRMWTLESLSELQVSQEIQSFMKPLGVVDFVTTPSFTGKGFHAKSEYLLFSESGTASASFEVPEAASFSMTIIARGDKVSGKWPLVKVFVDGEFLSYKYVRRNAWDCFSLDIVLESGKHDVELEFVNGWAENNTTDVRTLSLRSIYVIKPGAV